MDKTQKINTRVTILNKFGATHPSITGKSARQLADFLYINEVDVRVISIKAHYKGKQRDKSLLLPFQSIELKGLYNGCNKYLRLLTNLIDGFRLVVRSLIGRKDDVKIVMTDPSLINMWAVLLKPFYRSKLIFWTMDLYPDAFCSAGLVKVNNPFFRLLSFLVYHFPPDFLIALGSCQYHYLSAKYARQIPYALLPCGINSGGVTELPWWRKEFKDKIILCYAGNLGEAHDDRFLEELIIQLNPEKHVLLLALYGAKAKKVLQCANQNKGIILLDYISPDQLHFVDVNIASLLPAWNHVCVPSKVVSAICANTPVLYNASTESEGYYMFPKAIWLINKSDEYSREINSFYKSMDIEVIEQKRKAAILYAQKLETIQKKAFKEIVEYCKNETVKQENSFEWN